MALWILAGSTAVVVLGLAVAPLVMAADARWPVSPPDYHQTWWAVALRTVVYPLGKGEIQLAIVLAIGLMGARRRAAAAVLALAVVAASVAVLKPAVGRVRPSGTPDSYPSGDTASAAAAAVPLAAGSWAAAPVAVAVVASVAVFRVLDGVHHPGDVVTGAVLGGLCGLVGHFWNRRRRPPPADRGGSERGFALWLAVCCLFIAWGAVVEHRSHAILGAAVHGPWVAAAVVWFRLKPGRRQGPDAQGRDQGAEDSARRGR